MTKTGAPAPRPFGSGTDPVARAAEAHRRRSRILADAAERLAAGERAKRARAASSMRGRQAGGPVRLSRREVETVALYVSGHSARSVAERLGVGYESVRTMLKRSRAKYAAKGYVVGTKEHLRQRLVDDGLIEPDIARSAR